MRKVLLTQSTIQSRITELACDLDAWAKDTETLLIVGILSGAVVFVSDLIRQMRASNLRVGWLRITSYIGQERGTAFSHNEFICDTDFKVGNCRCLIVDDVADSGTTLRMAKQSLINFGIDEKAIRTAVVVRKWQKILPNCNPDYHLYDIPDVFVVGYGMDHRGLHRNLPYIAEFDGAEAIQGVLLETQC